MSSPVSQVLADYVAGRATAEALVRAVRAAHYGEATRTEPAWHALVETIERAMPGTLELTGTTDAPGFALRPLARPVAGPEEAELRAAARQALAALALSGTPALGTPVTAPAPPGSPPGRRTGGSLWARVLRGLRRLFSASV